ncbi:MAG: UDP-2,4-diacetamido-2,4,6-trideoxy-beta-L-altropyranose hydrolase [Arcobacter sp.]|uniref:UDP-2,4-diacetamido-2,4, 6-trideoxy-beta-L-altropyranose hydrolase n=1 Tax=Arcobacter sp. TaxID=1872629 RepID=UPI003B00402C
MSNKIKNILIRADSSSKIGIGHIMRDLVLVKQYSNSNITFACQELDGNINSKAIESGYNLKILNSNDVEELDDLIKSLNIDFLIIDHYGIDEIFEKQLKIQNLKLKILSFDDTYEKHYCDILLNHNIYAQEKKYKDLVPDTCELRCGEKYILIREEFKYYEQLRRNKSKNKKILIAFGGSDFDNISLKVLKSLKKKKDIKIYLLTTKANKNIKSLKSYIKGFENIKLIINSKNVAKLIHKTDLAIVSPSTILHEIIYLNKEFIVIQTATNQKFMMKYLRNNKYACMKRFSKKSFLEKFEVKI